MCRGRGLPLWHSRARCHGDPKQGPGASSPQTWRCRRPRVWSSAALPNAPCAQWRLGAGGPPVSRWALGNPVPSPALPLSLRPLWLILPLNPFVRPATSIISPNRQNTARACTTLTVIEKHSPLWVWGGSCITGETLGKSLTLPFLLNHKDLIYMLPLSSLCHFTERKNSIWINRWSCVRASLGS